MSDNVPIVPGTGATSVVAALDIGLAEAQRVVPMARAGASAVDVTASTPLPVIATQAGTATVTLTNPAAAPLATVAVGTLALPTLMVLPPATIAVGTVAGLPTVSLAGGTVTLSNPAQAPLATVAIGTIAALPTTNVVPPATVSIATVAGLPTVSLAGGTVTLAALPTVAVGTLTFPQLPLTATYQAGVGAATIIPSGLLKGFSVYANGTDVWWRIGASGVAAGATAMVRNGAVTSFNPAGTYSNPIITVPANADYVVEYQST